MQIDVQAVFAKLQSRIAQLELDKAVVETALEETQARLTALEEEHAKCGAEVPTAVDVSRSSSRLKAALTVPPAANGG
jgi:uncharacterized coiled-coil protein SlyX